MINYPSITCAFTQVQLKIPLWVRPRMIVAFSLRPIPFYQDNCSFQFDADDNSRCLSFPDFLALFCSVFFFILDSSLKWGVKGLYIFTPWLPWNNKIWIHILLYHSISFWCFYIICDVVIYPQAKIQRLCSNSILLLLEFPEKFLKHYWLRKDVFQRNRF